MDIAPDDGAGFAGSTFTEERWHAMAAGSPYAGARSLLAYDDRGTERAWRPITGAAVLVTSRRQRD